MMREHAEAHFEERVQQHTERAARAQAETDRLAAQRQTILLTRIAYSGWGGYLTVWGAWLVALQPRDALSYESLGEPWAWWALGLTAVLVGLAILVLVWRSTTQRALAGVAALAALLSVGIVAVFVFSGSLSTGMPTYAFHALGHASCSALLTRLHAKEEEPWK